MKARVLNILLGLLLLLVILLLFVYLRYGGGEDYPDLSTEPLLDDAALEAVVQYPEPIGNVAVAADGRVFFTAHPEGRPIGPKLLVFADGRATAFPDRKTQQDFRTPLGVVIDRQERLWVIDSGQHGLHQAELSAFDIHTGERVFRFGFDDDHAPLGSMLQDLQISNDGEWAYIADVSFWRQAPAILVMDLVNRRVRRVLVNHESTAAQDWVIRTPYKRMEFFGGLAALKPGVDGIALSRDGLYLYYGAMTHDTLYRIPTSLLRDTTPRSLIEASVEAVGPKPLNDGMSTDEIGTVYLTDVEHQGVMIHQPDGRLLTLLRSERIRWADALSFGPDGWLYIADSGIPQMMLEPRDTIIEHAPYTIWRIKLPVRPVAGH
ncbi:MAG: L-dopachrome tautomerase-related protein [Gammaproteobacteria bacterium]|nr:L-dopachrome tautomerase-related protein [Gammaproteobacteria bacterium]